MNLSNPTFKGGSTTIGTHTATAIVKSGGTASQFLKADGSVDNNVYLTSIGTVSAITVTEHSSSTSDYPIVWNSGTALYKTAGKLKFKPSTGQITANIFKTAGGTSSQFVKGDGSLSSTTYDDYGFWRLYKDNFLKGNIFSTYSVDFKQGNNVTIDHVLNGTKHELTINAAVTGGANSLIDLNDVSLATATDKHALFGNGTTFASRALVEADISNFGTYEPAFTKNGAFNKDFGTNAGQVAEGNHTHSGWLLDTTDTFTGVLSIFDGNVTGDYRATSLKQGANTIYDYDWEQSTYWFGGNKIMVNGSNGDVTFNNNVITDKIKSKATTNFYIYRSNGVPFFTMNNSTGDIDTGYNITANDFIGSSDREFKEDINDLVSLEIKSNYKRFRFKGSSQIRFGVIAQDLEVEHPEFVRTNEDGKKSVSYIDLHNAEINYLKNKVKYLEDLIKNK